MRRASSGDEPRGGVSRAPGRDPSQPKKDKLGQGFSGLKPLIAQVKQALVFTAVVSGVVNVLMLSGSLFMLQVYDRVLPSRSVPTLMALVALVIVLYAFTVLLETIRSRTLARVGRHLDAKLAPEVFALNLRRGLTGGGGAGPFRDLEQVRGFLASGGPPAIMDLPWAPLYLAFLFLLHPWLGLLGLGGMLALAGLTWATERATSPIQRSTSDTVTRAAHLADTAQRGAETILPMGMGRALQGRWRELNLTASGGVVAASDATGLYGGGSRFLRMGLQSVVLAVGAYLVITGRATGGIMIGASILFGRALAPVETAIVHWRGLVGARQAYGRLLEGLEQQPEPPAVSLPLPRARLTVERLSVAPPGAAQPAVRDVTFEVLAGDAVGVIGPSGAGKSSVARVIAGVWPAARGAVRFDGATLDQWTDDERGQVLGYLPQQVELFAGTVGENIARFAPQAPSDKILVAARLAGVDDFIRALPEGYDTEVGPRGERFSAGQKQRLALARALYGDPPVIILDEPNAALDAEGEAALSRAILAVRRRGGMVVIVAHRPSALQAANKVLLLGKGRQQAFGPRDEVLNLTAPPNAAPVRRPAVEGAPP